MSAVDILRNIVLAGVLALAACGEAETPIPPGAIVRLSDEFSADFSLIDHNGQPATDETFRGRTMIVYAGFATCPDVCPMALGTLSAALAELKPSERAKLAPVFLTVDPERDTPEALKAFLAFNPDITGVTGSRTAVDAALANYKVYAKRQALPGSALGYTMDHTSLFYIVNPDGRLTVAVHDERVDARQLAAILRRAIKGGLT